MPFEKENFKYFIAYIKEKMKFFFKFVQKFFFQFLWFLFVRKKKFILKKSALITIDFSFLFHKIAKV